MQVDNLYCWILYVTNLKLNSSICIILVLMSLCIITIILCIDKKFKKINNNINYREELFHSLGFNVNDVFIVYDCINEKHEYISPNFEKTIGISCDALINNKSALLDIVSPETKNSILNMLFEAPTSSVKEIIFEFIHPVTNERQKILLRIYPIFKNNVINRYIFCMLEITKEYQSQEAIKEALSEVKKANEAKKAFLSHMSHELKNPINAIIGMTEIASKSLNDPGKVINCLEKINYSSRNLLSLINNILDSTKIDSDKLLLINEPFHLHDAITSFSSTMTSQTEIRNLEFTLVYHQMEHDHLIGDSLRLTQILGNCLSNSIKFTPPGGKITLEISEISVTENKGLYRFEVRDTGKGMQEEYIDRIFTPYEQEDNTICLNFGGTGLGMSIVKTLLILMGGGIHIESKVGVGTIITIDIEFELAVKIPDQTKHNDNVQNIMEYDCSGMRVLIVEDNEINLEIACEFLNYINVGADTAMNGYDAIKLFETSEAGYYDAILMDVQMPGINGYETTSLIRSLEHPDASIVYIIAMTADNFVNNFSCIQCGMNYHITKPIDIDKFYSILHTIKIREEIFT